MQAGYRDEMGYTRQAKGRQRVSGQTALADTDQGCQLSPVSGQIGQKNSTRLSAQLFKRRGPRRRHRLIPERGAGIVLREGN